MKTEAILKIEDKQGYEQHARASFVNEERTITEYGIHPIVAGTEGKQFNRKRAEDGHDGVL